MAATMEDEDMIAAARNSSEEIVYVDDDDAAVITVLEEDERVSRGDVSPDGGIFSGGASEASASNECEL